VFTPVGKWLASTPDADTFQLFEVDGKGVREMQAKGCVRLGVSADGETLACGEGEPPYNAHLLDKNGKRLVELEGHTFYVQSIAFSPSGGTIATASSDHTVRLWSAAGKPLHTLQGHTEWVTAVRFSPDGRRLVSAGMDHSVRVWDVAGAPLHTFEGLPDGPAHIDISRDGKWLVAAFASAGETWLWSFDDYQHLLTLRTVRGLDGGYAFTDSAIEFLGEGAAKARAFPYCRFGARTYPYELCAGRFETPGLLAAMMSDDGVDAAR
jgi:WD40 repeat protein